MSATKRVATVLQRLRAARAAPGRRALLVHELRPAAPRCLRASARRDRPGFERRREGLAAGIIGAENASFLFFSLLAMPFLNVIILLRQARDKHRTS
jgi:hypothetical protein